MSLVAFGKAAEALAQHRKGDLVLAMGPMTRARYTDSNGNEKASWSLRVESLLSVRTTHERDGQPNLENPNSTYRRRHTHPKHRLARDPVPELPCDSVADLYADIIP